MYNIAGIRSKRIPPDVAVVSLTTCAILGSFANIDLTREVPLILAAPPFKPVNDKLAILPEDNLLRNANRIAVIDDVVTYKTSASIKGRLK